MSLRMARAGVVIVAACAALFALVVPSSATTTPTTPSTGTSPSPLAPAGVIVNADGVLRTETFEDQTGALRRRRVEEAQASLNDKVAARRTCARFR